MSGPRALALTLAAAVAGLSSPAARADDVVARIDNLYAKAIPADGPGGVVLVLRQGKVIARRAYGLANVELKVAMQPELRFRIASISKQVTAVAILQLVQAGAIDLEAPIGRYLRNPPASWAPITVAQLLNHTSGLVSPGDVTPELKLAITSAATGDELRKLLDAQPLHSTPGTQHSYNNWGYALLGQMIENLSGTPYCDYLRAKLLGPLGMTQTQCPAGRRPIAGVVSGYDRDDDRALATPHEPVSKAPLVPAGGLVSNADDLARWSLALHGGKLLSAEGYARLIAITHLPSGEDVPYGFGTRLRTQDGRPLVVSNGDGPGYHSEIAVDAASGCIVIALYNFGPRYQFFSRRLLAIARGQPIAPPATVAVPAHELAKLVGEYTGGGRSRRTIELDAGVLYSRRDGDPVRDPLVAVTGATFRLADDDDTRLTFVASRGEVTAMRIATDGMPGEVVQNRTRAPAKP